MRYDYDVAADALYVRFGNEAPRRQVRLGDGTIVDLGENDAVVGVEVLVPSSIWDPDAIVRRWPLKPEELKLLHALARSFRAPPLVSAEGGGEQVAPNTQLAA